MTDRLDILRGLECEAYRLAYYLLEAEEPACEAAKRALLAVYRVRELPRLAAESRRRLLRRHVIAESAAEAAALGEAASPRCGCAAVKMSAV